MEEVFFLARYEVLVVKYIMFKQVRVTFVTVHNATRFLCRFQNVTKTSRYIIELRKCNTFQFKMIYLTTRTSYLAKKNTSPNIYLRSKFRITVMCPKSQTFYLLHRHRHACEWFYIFMRFHVS